MNLIYRLNKFLDELFCIHEYMTYHKSKRMFLVCAKCGKETKGWNL